mgnify:CR=1 FL=1
MTTLPKALVSFFIAMLVVFLVGFTSPSFAGVVDMMVSIG